jgi:hypothetical protein
VKGQGAPYLEGYLQAGKLADPDQNHRIDKEGGDDDENRLETVLLVPGESRTN